MEVKKDIFISPIFGFSAITMRNLTMKEQIRKELLSDMQLILSESDLRYKSELDKKQKEIDSLKKRIDILESIMGQEPEEWQTINRTDYSN